MPLSDRTVAIDELAAALRVSESWIRRNHKRLSNCHGFPRKLPAGLTWPRGPVEAWLDAGGGQRRARTGGTTLLDAEFDPEPIVAAQTAFLSQRYGGHA